MHSQPYSNLILYKQWADRGLYDVIGRNFHRLPDEDAAILLRILDHIRVVDWIFQHHLQELPHGFQAPRSEGAPDLRSLAEDAEDVDDWYARYVANLSLADFEQALDFVFTSGAPAHMTRGEIILHICLHGTYHRGNAGLVLQKNGIAPNDDRMTDFLEEAA